MTQELAPNGTTNQLPVTTGNPIFDLIMNEQMFNQLQRGAKLFSESGLVPKTFKGNPAACFVGLQLSAQLGVSPFLLFQRIYSPAEGKIGIESQLAIALANQKGVFTGPIEYEWSGTEGQDDWTCTAVATLARNKKEVRMPITWKMVKAEGWDQDKGTQKSKWKTIPEQMFRYRSAGWLIKTYTPEILLGLEMSDELDDTRTINITPAKPAGSDQFADALRTGKVVDAAPVSTGQEKPPATAPDSGQDGVESADPGKDTPPAPETPQAGDIDDLPSLFEQAGLAGQPKANLRRNMVKTATSGRTEILEECTEDEIKLVAATLRNLIERNEKRKAGGAA